MNMHLKSKAEIEKRQEAVRELAPELEMRQHFRVLGLLHKVKLLTKKKSGTGLRVRNIIGRNGISELWLSLSPPPMLSASGWP